MFALAVGRNGKQISEGIIGKNGVFKFDGYCLEMKELPYWVRFSVIKEHGVYVIYTGFLMAVIAVIWRFLFYKRELVGTITKNDSVAVLVVAGKSEFYKSLAVEEFDNLFNRIFSNKGSSVI